MAMIYDEISLEYWKNNKKKIGSSKSFTCKHKGYIYGDDMKCFKIEFVYVKDDEEYVYSGKHDGPKWAYFEMVEAACNQLPNTLNQFLNNAAEKFRIYTAEQVASFTSQKRNSTRIKDDSCMIDVNGTPYYVANNLKVCEYFNSASINVDSSELRNWFIRIYFNDDDIVKTMEDTDETEILDIEKSSFELRVHQVPKSSKEKTIQNNRTTITNVDFSKVNAEKKRVGDVGEAMVLNYEKKRLMDAGKSELAEKVEHVSVTQGDGLGYDIKSYQEDGTPLYIEVKTTKQNIKADFYLSKREKNVANLMYEYSGSVVKTKI